MAKDGQALERLTLSEVRIFLLQATDGHRSLQEPAQHDRGQQTPGDQLEDNLVVH